MSTSWVRGFFKIRCEWISDMYRKYWVDRKTPSDFELVSYAFYESHGSQFRQILYCFITYCRMIDDINTNLYLLFEFTGTYMSSLSQSHRSRVYLGCESAVDIHVDYEMAQAGNVDGKQQRFRSDDFSRILEREFTVLRSYNLGQFASFLATKSAYLFQSHQQYLNADASSIQRYVHIVLAGIASQPDQKQTHSFALVCQHYLHTDKLRLNTHPFFLQCFYLFLDYTQVYSDDCSEFAGVTLCDWAEGMAIFYVANYRGNYTCVAHMLRLMQTLLIAKKVTIISDDRLFIRFMIAYHALYHIWFSSYSHDTCDTDLIVLFGISWLCYL